jgi:hypothetical protein
LEELLISARRRANADHVIWGMTLLIPLLIGLDRSDEALALDREAVQLFGEKDRLNGPNFHGSHVQALVAQGLTAQAIPYARHALKTLGAVPIWFHLGGLTAMTQACIEMLGRQRGTTLEKDAHKVSRRSLRALRAYLRVYPFSRARFYLYLGMYRAAEGRNRAARRLRTRVCTSPTSPDSSSTALGSDCSWLNNCRRDLRLAWSSCARDAEPSTSLVCVASTRSSDFAP